MINRRIRHSYFVVMQDLGGRYGYEAVVQPEITRSEIIRRLKTGEYKDVAFIHFVDSDLLVEDVTHELIELAEQELHAEAA